MFPIAFITDEATQSFDEAVRLAGQLGLRGLELRSVEDTPIDRVSHEKLRGYAEAKEQHNLHVIALASSFYKEDLSYPAIVAAELEKLERLCDAADILDTQYIRGFAGLAADSGRLPASELAAFFEAPRKILESRNKKLLLEADPHMNTSNHQALAQLLDLLASECFGAIYDPGNSLYDPLGEKPFPDAYEAVREHIRHVHIKDARHDDDGNPYCLRPGDGLVPYPELLQRLKDDGYRDWLSLETHYRKDSRLTDGQMLRPQGSAFSAGGTEAMAESAASLHNMLESL